MTTSFDISYVFNYFLKLLPFIQTSLLIVGSSIALGIVIGFLLAIPRLYQIPVLQGLAKIYVSFFRGTPILIQLFLIYYGLPELLKLVYIDVSKLPVLAFVIVTYSLHSGAFISEGIRAAVTAVDRGQVEAAYAVGMTGYQAFTRIVLPQALAISIPILSNLVIATLKDTSLAFTLGVMELTGKAQTLPTMSRHFLETYIALALLYLIISVVLEKLFQLLEWRLLHYENTASAETQVSRSRQWFTHQPIARTLAKTILVKGGSEA